MILVSFKNQPHSSELQLCISKDALGGLWILCLFVCCSLVQYPTAEASGIPRFRSRIDQSHLQSSAAHAYAQSLTGTLLWEPSPFETEVEKDQSQILQWH